MIPQILQTLIHYDPQISDEDIWSPNTFGNFTCSSAWEIIRDNKQINFSNKKTWQKKNPIQMVFFPVESFKE